MFDFMLNYKTSLCDFIAHYCLSKPSTTPPSAPIERKGRFEYEAFSIVHCLAFSMVHCFNPPQVVGNDSPPPRPPPPGVAQSIDRKYLCPLSNERHRDHDQGSTRHNARSGAVQEVTVAVPQSLSIRRRALQTPVSRISQDCGQHLSNSLLGGGMHASRRRGRRRGQGEGKRKEAGVCLCSQSVCTYIC